MLARESMGSRERRYHLADGIQGSLLPSLNCIEVNIDPT